MTEAPAPEPVAHRHAASVERALKETSRRQFLRSGFRLGAAGTGIAVAASSGLVLATTQPAAAAANQDNWRYCNKCYVMFYGGFAFQGICFDGAPHYATNATSYNYKVRYRTRYGEDMRPYQADWAYCPRCACLTYAPNFGLCPDGHNHYIEGASLPYAVFHDFIPQPDPTNWQMGWRFCTRCKNIAYNYSDRPDGWCGAGGRHNHVESNYHYGFYFGSSSF